MSQSGTIALFQTSSDEDTSEKVNKSADLEAAEAANSFTTLFLRIIGKRVVVSKGDILVKVQNYAAMNNLTFTRQTNLVIKGKQLFR